LNWWLWHTWCSLLGLVDVILLLTTLALLLSALFVLVVTSSALASTTASVATSTSVGSVSSLVVTITAMMLISALVATVVVTLREVLLTHDVPDELFKTCSTFLFCFLFQVILSLPEVDLKSLGAVTKAVRSVEHLDASLCGLNVSIEDETKLVVRKSFTVDSLCVILQSN